MAVFEITAPNGKRYQIEGDTREGAVTALKKHIGVSVSEPPEGMFMNPVTGQMTNRDLLKANEQPNMARAAASGYTQGYAMEGADEGLGFLGKTPEMRKFRTEQARARFDADQDAHPVAYTGGKIVGALTNPIGQALSKWQGVKGALGAPALEGFVEGFGAGEGEPGYRAENALKTAGQNMLFGGLTAGLFRAGRGVLSSTAKRVNKRPTLENLKFAKNMAYRQVRESGIEFTEEEMIGAWSRIDDLAKDPRWDLDPISEVDKGAFDAMRVLERRAENPISLNNLDKTRQKLWDIYNKSDHPFVLQAIEELDGLVENRAAGDAVMQAARDANRKYAQAELLNNAFRKARLQTASTGSGGNILNKYRQAVTRIVTNPRESRWFDAEQIALMERFIEGDDVENSLRLAGKLSPSGNGLMTALNVYAATVDPAMLAVTAAGTAAKRAADKSALSGSERILDAVSTGKIPQRQGVATGGMGIAGGIFGRELLGQ